jgi:hypothetical protein
MANKLMAAIPSLILLILIMAIGTFFGVDPTITFIGAVAVAFGVYIGIVKVKRK